jgi:glycosyltransferase involved in cell wall biosynthesis
VGDLAVVMATYDGGRWIGEQLASIAAQTRPPDLLVVSDDGSTDDTVDVVARFARTAPFPVRLVDGPRTGLADNFWSAAARAGGCELIAWADQDDVWEPAKLARCEEALRRSGAAFACHSAVVVDDALRPTGRRFPDHRRNVVLGPLEGDPWDVPSGFASVFRRELLDGIRWGDRPTSHQTGRPVNHDHAVSLRAFAGASRVAIADPLARYRQHGGNAAGAPTVHGAASVRAAMAVGGAQFHRLAVIARGYGDHVAGLDGVAPGAADYFTRLAGRCDLRAASYEPRRATRRVRRLAGGLRAGVYAPRTRGGFGPLALAKDAVDVGVRGLSRSEPAPT